LHERLDAALKRLATALDALEAVEAQRRGPDDTLVTLENDRAKLQAELEEIRCRAKTLEAAHDEVLARLNRAQAAIQSILVKTQA
jgi:chromosome segregation ATPase